MQIRHFLQLIAMSALWGASFPLLRIASPAFGPWVLAGLRCLLAACVLTGLMYALRERWPPRAAWPRLALLSLLTVAAPFLLFNWAALVIPAGYSAVLNATAPLFGVLGAALAGEERLNPRNVLGCALGFAGVALLVRLGPVAVTPQVVLAALACTLAAAWYGFGTLLMLPAGLAAPSVVITPGAVMAVMVLGTLTSGFMYWISMRLMREISASAATSAIFMIPLFGVSWGALFLGEPVTASMLPGGVLVLAATALVAGFNPFRGTPPEP